MTSIWKRARGQEERKGELESRRKVEGEKRRGRETDLSVGPGSLSDILELLSNELVHLLDDGLMEGRRRRRWKVKVISLCFRFAQPRLLDPNPTCSTRARALPTLLSMNFSKP